MFDVVGREVMSLAESHIVVTSCEAGQPPVSRSRQSRSLLLLSHCQEVLPGSQEVSNTNIVISLHNLTLLLDDLRLN